MKTLAQMRNGVLKKLNKKRKLEFSSLVMSPATKQTDQRRKLESINDKLLLKKNHRVDPQNHEECRQGHPSFCSTASLKRLRKHKKKKDKVVLDEAAQLQKRARYLLLKLKLQQNLIDAYSGEGWKGQSREKIRPEKELLRAEDQILKCKLGIRDTIHQLDLLGSIGKIDDSLISPDGSVHHEDIFCKKCKSQEVSEDNDIILCDGTCNCAFHQKCIDPPLATKDIPPEDEGWLCKYCDCKMEILEATNAHLGTQFSVDSTWQDIFKEEALLSKDETRHFNPEEEWPDDDSDDYDYDPDGEENNSSNMVGMEDNDLHEEISPSGSCCSLESEVLSEYGFSAGRNGVSSNFPSLHQHFVTESNGNEIASGSRKRGAVDYQKLYDEMFGKDSITGELISEDEDWDPSKRRRREKESDVASTLMTLCESEDKHSDVQTLEVANNHLPNVKARKPLSRIPSDAVQKLRQAFSENELPSRDAKRNIAELVGLEYGKVNKWFKNARYMALKKKRERASGCSREGFDPAADDTTGLLVSKCSSKPISIHKKKRLENVSWKANLMTLISPSKKQKLKKTPIDFTQATVELSDDMSLKRHLLYLKAKCRRKETVKRKAELQRQNLEKQMEYLCCIEAKLWKLKQELSTIQKVINNESDGRSLHKQVVYVPIAELKEKAQG